LIDFLAEDIGVAKCSIDSGKYNLSHFDDWRNIFGFKTIFKFKIMSPFKLSWKSSLRRCPLRPLRADPRGAGDRRPRVVVAQQALRAAHPPPPVPHSRGVEGSGGWVGFPPFRHSEAEREMLSLTNSCTDRGWMEGSLHHCPFPQTECLPSSNPLLESPIRDDPPEVKVGHTRYHSHVPIRGSPNLHGSPPPCNVAPSVPPCSRFPNFPAHEGHGARSWVGWCVTV